MNDIFTKYNESIKRQDALSRMLYRHESRKDYQLVVLHEMIAISRDLKNLLQDSDDVMLERAHKVETEYLEVLEAMLDNYGK